MKYRQRIFTHLGRCPCPAMAFGNTEFVSAEALKAADPTWGLVGARRRKCALAPQLPPVAVRGSDPLARHSLVRVAFSVIRRSPIWA